MVLTVLAAFGAAAGFAVSTALQHLCAVRVPVAGGGALYLLRRLLRQPLWWIAQITAGLGFVLHAAALGGGALALVQPIMVSGLVLTVLVQAVLARRAPSGRELVNVCLVAIGLALLLAGAPSENTGGGADDSGTPDGRAGAVVAAGVALALFAVCAAVRSSRSTVRGVFLGVGAGALFGLLAGVLKLAVHDLGGGVLGLLTDWPVWALLLLGAGGLLLNQRAYQVAPLSASMPASNVVDPLLAIAFGVVVFGERPGTATLLLAGDVVGFVLMAVGTYRLAGEPT